MVALYNLIPFFLLVVTIGVAYLVKKLHLRVIVAMIGVLLMLGYNKFQPSYGPKGVVQRSVTAEFRMSDKPMVDNLRKNVDSTVRDERMRQERLEIERRLGENQN